MISLDKVAVKLYAKMLQIRSNYKVNDDFSRAVERFQLSKRYKHWTIATLTGQKKIYSLSSGVLEIYSKATYTAK